VSYVDTAGACVPAVAAAGRTNPSADAAIPKPSQALTRYLIPPNYGGCFNKLKGVRIRSDGQALSNASARPSVFAMHMPKPGPGHEKLSIFAGAWEGPETMHASAFGPGSTATGKIRARVDIDGFFVISDYVQENAGGVSYRGHGVYGYDPKTDEYTWYWVDSMGMPAAVARGKWHGDTLTFESATSHGQGRYVYRFEGRDKHHFSIENSMDGGSSWIKFMDATYVRQT